MFVLYFVLFISYFLCILFNPIFQVCNTGPRKSFDHLVVQNHNKPLTTCIFLVPFLNCSCRHIGSMKINIQAGWHEITSTDEDPSPAYQSFEFCQVTWCSILQAFLCNVIPWPGNVRLISTFWKEANDYTVHTVSFYFRCWGGKLFVQETIF